MNKNTAKIRDGIKQLAHQPYEILSGVVVAGSLDASAHTVDVKPSGSDTAIEGVFLNAVAGENKGMLLIPKDGSHVVIGSIDGPGEWVLLRASELEKAIVEINNTRYEITDGGVTITNGSLTFDVGSALFKMNTASESLYHFLNDLITAISAITVSNSAGITGTPLNFPAFNALSARLNNLLTA